MKSQGSMSYLYMGVIVPLCIIIPLSIGVCKYRALPAALKTFVWYLVLSGLASIITKFLAKGNNLPILHIYTLLEFSVFAVFYSRIFESRSFTRLLPVFIAVFAVLCVVNATFFQSIWTFNSYTRSIEAIFIMTFAIMYFLRSLEKMDVKGRNKEAVLWINAALLIYFSGALILFIVSNMVIYNVALGSLLWNINATLVLIMYLLFAAGLWKAVK